jgi:hypothetical protein
MVSHKTNDNIAKRDLKLLQLEEEINRLFRSNAFNISSRTQFDEQRK